MELAAARHRLELRLEFTVPKTARYPNEDSWQSSKRRGVYAISDGASISFDSASWSRILVRRFAKCPEVTSKWLEEAIAEFSRLYDRDVLPWMMQAAFDRGSFASLLGVRQLEGPHQIQVFAVGDSIAVLCDGDRIVSTFPYSDASEFERSPQLFSTNRAENVFFAGANSSDNFMVYWTVADHADPTLFCMTDALGQWFLANQDTDQSPVATLRGIATRKQFVRFVHAERTAGRMRRDDTTLVALW